MQLITYKLKEHQGMFLQTQILTCELWGSLTKEILSIAMNANSNCCSTIHLLNTYNNYNNHSSKQFITIYSNSSRILQ